MSVLSPHSRSTPETRRPADSPGGTDNVSWLASLARPAGAGLAVVLTAAASRAPSHPTAPDTFPMAPRGLLAAASVVASASSSAATTAESLAGQMSVPSSRKLETLSWPRGSCNMAKTDAAGSLASALARILSSCHRDLLSPRVGGSGKDCNKSTMSSAASAQAIATSEVRSLRARRDARVRRGNTESGACRRGSAQHCGLRGVGL